MINAFYSAASGLKSQQTSIDVRANNIANINTTAYKTQRADFSEVLTTNIFNSELKTGNGVNTEAITGSFGQGMLEDTGMPLDCAISGEGFFAVRGANGSISYTRDGNFNLLLTENGMALVTANGENVLDSKQSPIIYNGNAEDIIFSASGAEIGNAVVNIGVFTFDNPFGLSEAGGNRYAATNSSGEARLLQNALISQGKLERSTVDLASEMTKIIEAQRSFQLNARMLQTADELESTANNLR